MSINTNIFITIIWILLIGYFIYEGYSMQKVWRKKKCIYWTSTRILIIFLLFLCSSKCTFNMKSRDTTTIFLVDRSLSVNKYKKDIEKYVNYEIDKKNKGDKIAVISFAQDTAIELPLTYEKQKVQLSCNVNNNFTNFEKGINFAIDYFPKKDNRRLVIITDKKENAGDINNTKNKLKSEKINLIVKEIHDEIKDDVQLTKVHIPEKIYNQGNIPSKIQLDSTYVGKGNVHFYINDKKILSKELVVKKGKNIFNVLLPLNEKKEITLKTEIDFKGDNNKLNNVYTLERTMSKDNKVLLISDDTKDVENINRLLDGLDIKRENYSSNSIVNNVNFLSDFNEIIMVNTDCKNLPKGFDENLNKAVKELGTGLLVVGGEKSFALGAYENTKLEDMLPVSCNMQNKRKQADTGLILLIDCSGSMDDESGGMKKIELAKKGAIEAVKALEGEDYVGVLAFSDTLEWIVPFQKIKSKDKLIKDIGKLRSKGGTLIIPGLVDGIDKIKSAPVKVKHMILLTDGQAEKKGFDKYIKDMKKNNITMSTVGVGEDCDKEVLKYLSSSTNGRGYFSKSFNEVPQIMSKETKISQKKYINNEIFTPKQKDNQFNKEGSILPKLKGYMGTGIKKGANLILESNREDPIFAIWNYGLGKVGVWTSDLSGKWSEYWINWNGFSKYWSRIMDCLSKSKQGKYTEMNLNMNGGNVQVLVKSKKGSKEKEPNCKVICPNNKEEDINMMLCEGNIFKGNFSLKEKGKYKFLTCIKQNNKLVDKVEKTLYLDYSPEFSIKKNNDDLDEAILQCSGKYLKSEESIFKQPIVNRNVDYIQLDFIFMPIIFLLFLFDIYLRIKY